MSIALIVCIVGGIVYFLFRSDHYPYETFAEIGRLAFFAGLLAYLLKG